jgi:hypothetical protein
MVNISSSWNRLLDTWQYDLIRPNNVTPSPSYELMGGALFRDSFRKQTVALYGGAPILSNDTSNILNSFSRVPEELWSFDLLRRTWMKNYLDVQGVSTSPILNLSRHGVYVQAPDHNLGFFLDLSTLNVVDTSSRKVRHTLTTLSSSNQSRVGGNVLHIPGVGKKRAACAFWRRLDIS